MTRRRTSYRIRCLQMLGTAALVVAAGFAIEGAGLVMRWLVTR